MSIILLEDYYYKRKKNKDKNITYLIVEMF